MRKDTKIDIGAGLLLLIFVVAVNVALFVGACLIVKAIFF